MTLNELNEIHCKDSPCEYNSGLELVDGYDGEFVVSGLYTKGGEDYYFYTAYGSSTSGQHLVIKGSKEVVMDNIRDLYLSLTSILQFHGDIE